MPNPGKIFGRHAWDKVRDTLKVQVRKNDVSQLTKRAILSRLGRIYDPLGVISPTIVEGKRIYRDTCEGERSWNAGVSPRITQQWNNWTKQLRDAEVPRSLVSGETKGVDLHWFSDASTMACCTAAIAVVEDGSGKSKRLLASKSRLSKRNTSVPTQQKTHNLFWPDENSIEQCFAAHIVQGCQQYCSTLLHLITG